MLESRKQPQTCIHSGELLEAQEQLSATHFLDVACGNINFAARVLELDAHQRPVPVAQIEIDVELLKGRKDTGHLDAKLARSLKAEIQACESMRIRAGIDIESKRACLLETVRVPARGIGAQRPWFGLTQRRVELGDKSVHREVGEPSLHVEDVPA